jgi:6-phosphogluconolactonase/glucosamine-6-phosphate isomerase/deaminase
MPVLASARHLVFLVTGQEKAQALRMTLAGPRASGGPRTPAGALLEMVASKALAGGEAPEVMWLVDAAAASDLPAG